MALPKKQQPSLLLGMGSDEEIRKFKGMPTCEWSPKAVATLLDSYSQKFFSGRGYLRNKDWEDVVNDVNGCGEGLKSLKTLKQCRDKVDSLKRRYKMEKRKAINGSPMTWPFFAKMDEMMGSVVKQGKEVDTSETHMPKPSLPQFRHMHEEEGEDNDKSEDSDSPEEYAVDRMRCLDNGKTRRGDAPGLLEDHRFIEDSFLHHHRQQFRKPVGMVGSQESTDNSSGQARGAYLRDSVHSRKRKAVYDDGVQALADAVTGFSEVYARIELAKMEILTKMKLEMAKLQRRRYRKGAKKQKSRASSTSSD